jgi:mono/diheme cytochrome c family protein
MQSEKRKIRLVIISVVIFILISAFSTYLYQQDIADKGACIYSAFDKVLNTNYISVHNPLWPSSLTSKISSVKSWRCSTCHGWNYQGMVTYGDEIVNFPGLENVSELTDAEILGWLDGTKNSDHDFSKYLTIESGSQLLSFFRDERFLKWAATNEVEAIESGNVSDGEEIYKQYCFECHGPQGAKVNFGSISKPRFLGDIMSTNGARIIHHLEFGSVSHEELFDREINLGDEDLLDLAKYLGQMPVSTSVLEERAFLQLRAFEDQGKLSPLITASFILFAILLTAFVVVSIHEKKQSDNK